MVRSSYSLDQLMEYPFYQDLCHRFLDMADDENTRSILESILYQGSYLDYSFVSGYSNKDNPKIEAERRVSMAYLFLRNPDTFSELCKSQITLFHGTNANALPNILKYGLNSVNQLQEKNIPVTTGETWSRFGGKRDFMSFTDILDVAEGYSTINNKQKDKSLSFPVVFGITNESALKSHITSIHSDVPEVGIKNCIPTDEIGVILVPSDKVELVRRLCRGRVKVLVADDITDKFYYIDEYEMYLNEEKYKEFKGRVHPQPTKLFGISHVLLSRSKEKMLDTIHKYKELFKGVDSYEHGNIK